MGRLQYAVHPLLAVRLLFSLRLDLGGQEGEEAAASVLSVLPLPIVVVVLALLAGTALSEITLVN